MTSITRTSPTPSPKKRLQREFSLSYSVLMYKHHTPLWHNVILGAQPLKVQLGSACDHQNEILVECGKKGAPLRLVVAAVEEYELDTQGLFNTPVPPQEWHDIPVQHVPINDYSHDLPQEETLLAIAKMKTTTDAGNSVYVHCKSGQGRSFMIASIFLSLQDLDSTSVQDEAIVTQAVEKTCARIKELRSQVSKSKQRKAAITDFIYKNKNELIKHQLITDKVQPEVNTSSELRAASPMFSIHFFSQPKATLNIFARIFAFLYQRIAMRIAFAKLGLKNTILLFTQIHDKDNQSSPYSGSFAAGYHNPNP